MRRWIRKIARRILAEPEHTAVITGIGIISPVGEGVDEWWQNLCNGVSGVDTIKQFDASSYPCTSAAEVKNWDALKYMPTRYQKMLSRGAQFTLAAFDLAKTDAGLDWVEPYGTDVIMGAGGPEYRRVEDELERDENFGVSFSNEHDKSLVFKTMVSAPASFISYRANTRGYVTTHVSACVSGLDAFNNAVERINKGQAHTVITGGVDTYVSKMVLQAFCSTNAGCR